MEAYSMAIINRIYHREHKGHREEYAKEQTSGFLSVLSVRSVVKSLAARHFKNDGS